MKLTIKRLIALLLCICMIGSVLPLQIWAEDVRAAAQTVRQGEQPETLTTPEGELPVEEDWDEAYPYGTFAFGSYQADVGEPGALTPEGEALAQTALLPVYRVGGTAGRVTVRITYAPAVTTDESGTKFVYDYAASGRSDLLIEAEDPNPLAAYQKIGLPEAERNMLPAPGVSLRADASGENSLLLQALDAEEATGFRWQYQTPDGFWKDVEGGTEQTLELTWEDYSVLGVTSWEDLDFRCVLTVEGCLLCTISLNGQSFTPWPEPAAVPEDLELPEEPGYTAVEFEDEYDIYAFDLTFADGETVKYVRVTALDDELAELPELGLFTIVGCEGGELSDLCNTLTLMVSDNDEGEASEIGFTVSAVTVDRKTGAAEATVRRTGGTSYSVTVDYETVDGTAKAGVDYAAKRGSLAFAGSIDEITVPIELISNEETGEKTFSLRLSNVKGGGAEDLCTLNADTVTFTLTGASPKGETGQNLASVLSGHDGTEAASRVNTAEDALIPEAEAQQNRVSMTQPEPVVAELVTSNGTRSFTVNSSFHFTRDNYSKAYWHDWEIIAGCGDGKSETDVADAVNDTGKFVAEVYDCETETYVTKTGGSAYGKDKNENVSEVRVSTRSDSREGFGTYLEAASNFKGSLAFGLGGGGKLYDQMEFAAYLHEVGVKKLTARTDRYIQPIISVQSGSGTKHFASADFEVGGTTKHRYYWYSNGVSEGSWEGKYGAAQGTDSWSGVSAVKSVPVSWNERLGFVLDFQMAGQWGKTDGYDWNEIMQNGGHTTVDIGILRAHRRVFANTDAIPLVVYTANDKNEAGGLWTPLPDGSNNSTVSAVYNLLAPRLSLVSGEGGVTSDGKLYYGSAFIVDISGVQDGYYVPDDGVFVTNSAGAHVGQVECVQSASSDENAPTLQWKVTMDWAGATEAALTDTYKINILLERSQKIQVDLGPSIGNSQAAAFDAFTGKTADVTCSVLGSPDADGRYFSASQTNTLTGSSYEGGGNAIYTTKTNYNNIQTINFKQDPADIILYNGRAYAGNATIKITADDMTQKTLHFVYYGKDYLDQVTPMVASIDHVELYYDRDGDEKISGTFENGVFLLEKDESGENTLDELITARLNGDYPESAFKPVITTDEAGKTKTHQYYMKVFYTLRPRAYKVPQGANASDKAQILPALASAVTDETAFAALTPEQQSYRYLKGANTDGHLMYGAAATALSYVDIPLGGDAGSVRYESVTTAVKDKNGKITGAETEESYVWTPAFVGNLLIQFDQPTPVIDTDNVTGHPVPMAGKDVPFDSKTNCFKYKDEYGHDDGSLAAMNAFLGSMTGRSTFVLGVQAQKVPLEELTLSQIQPETITMGTVATTPKADGLVNFASGGDAGATEGAAPGDDAGHPEFGADLGTELPSLELELGDYATLVIDGYQVGFAIGIPIYKYEDTNYSGSEKSETLSDGSKKESHKDGNGVLYETITAKDGRVTNITTTPDPNDPTKKTVVTQAVLKRKDGTTAYYNSTCEYKTDDKGKEHLQLRTVDTNEPPTEKEKTRGEKFKEGFQEANGGMQTLADFVSACKSRNLDKMKDFMSGAWEDDSLKNAQNGNCTSTKVEVSFTVQISIMFEYNPIDNCHYFKSAGLSASLGIELSAQHRFSVFPLAYVYVKLGIEVEVAVSLSCIRNPKLGDEITGFKQGSLSGLTQGTPVVFELNMKGKNPVRGFHIDLLGSVYMEIFDNPGLLGSPIDAGSLSGDGSEKEVLLEAYDEIMYVRLTPLRGQVIAENLRPVIGASSKVVFDGLSITPSISLEAGVGIGVELLKFELFVKTSFAITMTMGGYLPDTEKYEGFYISDFQWGLCLGFNVTALFFNYSMEVIGISVQGSQKGTGGYFSWEIKAAAADGMKELWTKNTYTARDGKSLGTEEPEELLTPNSNNFNIGPKDPGCVFYGAIGSNTWTEQITLTAENDFPDDCGWDLKENMNAYDWEGGVFRGEIPMDKDVVKATKDNSSVKLQIPAGSGEIMIYFDGVVSARAYETTEAGSTLIFTADKVRKAPIKVNVGENPVSVELYPTKGTFIDRWAVKEPEENGQDQAPAATQTRMGNGSGLIHVSGPTDVSATQFVTDANRTDTRSITPTGTADFELSGFNTAGDAKKLISGLTNGYSFKLFQADGENYILYPLMLDGTAQLVMSRVVMTGDLSLVSGLAHPTDPAAAEPWLKVDNDALGDLDYNVGVSGKTVTVVWTAYTGSASGTAVESAQSVAVKRAELRLGTDAAFSDPVILTEGTGRYRFLPAQTGTTAIWAESAGDGAQINQALAAYLIAANPGLTQEMLDARTTDNALLASAVYRWVLQSDLNSIYGDGSVLAASAGASAQIPGEFIENMELGSVGGKTLALYSTTQAAYFDTAAATPATVSPEAFDENTELATIRRLYLRELNGTAWGEALLLETVIDFDGCTDDNLETRVLQDGIYVGGSLETAQADPYFGNLKFLTADLDGTGTAEALLLFEMGGNSYLIRQADVLSLLSGGEGTVLPIFEQTTGTDVSIGSDGENLAVVYTAAVPGSLSNAIYTAWWDRNLGGWGSPTILAMRHLQVYEDGIKYDMDPKDLERAYLGKQNTPADNTGSMYRLYFSDLQMSTRKVTKDDGSQGTQLLVLTGGSLQKLQEFTLPMPDGEMMQSVAPDGSAELNFYAIAFGVGDQALGQGSLSLDQYDFSAGNRLVGGLSFVNTGTTAIRGSEDNPITVRLLVETGTGSQELANWKLKSSIPSGGSTNLSFYALELTSTLPSGATFWADVTEDPEYFGADAFSAVLPDLLKVEARPELSLTRLNTELIGVTGNTAYLKLEAAVINTGNADANGTYLQFAYDTGEKDANGLPVYRPVNITGSSLQTSAQAALSSRQAVAQDETNGVYQLMGPASEGETNDRACLRKGHSRTVTGTLAVPTSCFVSLEEFSGLHLRAETYSDFDSPDYNNGLYSSDHNEYNDSNNRAETIVKHRTIFNVPTRISTALGTTLTLPVSFESTSANPELVLTEISDGTPGWEPRMGICYYDPDRQVIVAAPNSTAWQMLENGEVPTGILQVKDVSTNSIVAITYKVGAMADGVNIYKDDASFTFHNANGTLTDLNAAAASNPGWMFLDRGVDLGWTGGETGEIPMNNDLSLCNQDGAYFTFDTVADTLTFYFMGELTVQSNVFGTAETFTASPAVIAFGNDTGMRHTVTVTGKTGTRIDRYAATYKTNPVVDADPNAPLILWNRSYPETASVRSGEGVPMTCYIVDGTGIKSVSFAGQTLSETTTPALVKLDDGLWYFEYTFTSNGAYTVQTSDLSDNRAKGTVGVDWFNDVLSSGAIADAPGLLRTHLSFVDASGSAVPADGTLTAAPFLKSSYTPESGEQSAAYLFSDGAFSADPLGKTTEERWLANWNGYYQVRIDRADGTWARAITLLTNLDDTPPSVTPDLPGNGTPDSPYLIGSREDWLKMQAYVNGGNPCVGMCFLQTADFGITEADMVGASGSRFRGVYDGGGYTLTFNSDSAPGDCAPFQYAENASFRNLHVDGEVVTTNKFTAGILADAYGICSFYNCRVSLTVRSDLNGDGTHGGLVSYTAPGSTVRITGCAVDGSFLGENTTLCGGFVGYCRGVLTIQDSVFAPAAWEWTGSQNFYRWQGTAERTLINSYYRTPNANNQGSLGWAVTPGTDVAFTRTGGKDYDVAGLYALSTGIFYEESLLAAEGETVSILPYYSGSDPDNAEDFFEASGGEFTAQGSNGYSLTMPGEDVEITIGRHDWGEPVYLWADDNSSVTARRVCAYHSTHVESETVQTTSEVTKPATCINSGKTTYTATFTNPAFETQTRTLSDIPALGHDLIHHEAQAPTCTEVGWEAYDTCSRCDYSTYVETPALGHDLIHHEAQAPTCTEIGWEAYDTCSRCDYSTYVETPALGHDLIHHEAQAPTCTEIGWEAYDTCSRCDYSTYVETPALGHDLTHHEAQAPTCTEIGWEAYDTCSRCDYSTYVEIPALEHDLIHHEAQAPTCTEIGWEAYDTCSRCDYSTYVEIPALEHDLIHHEAQAPTCTEIGWEAYDTCSRCDYSTYVETPALGHDWEEPVYTWEDDYSSVTATVICSRDRSHVMTETVSTEYIITKPSTYREEGVGTYVAEFESELFTTQTMQIVIPSISCDGGETCPSAHFTDIPGAGHWTHLPIDWAVVNKISVGTSATTFSPNMTCTRAQFVTFLWRTKGSPEPMTTENPFTDVKENTYYYKAVLWASENGITTGTSKTKFSPDQSCNRAQIVTFLWRMEGKPEPSVAESPFTDLKENAYYVTPVLWAYGKGITSGTSKTKFSPDKVCTRAEAVTFLYREFAQ